MTLEQMEQMETYLRQAVNAKLQIDERNKDIEDLKEANARSEVVYAEQVAKFESLLAEINKANP